MDSFQSLSLISICYRINSLIRRSLFLKGLRRARTFVPVLFRRKSELVVSVSGAAGVVELVGHSSTATQTSDLIARLLSSRRRLNSHSNNIFAF